MKSRRMKGGDSTRTARPPMKTNCRSSYRQQDGVKRLGWHRESIILEREDVALDAFADALDRCFASFALRHAAREA